MTEKQIKRVFSLVGLSITATASAAGILVACIVSALLNRYPLISLPDVYFASHLPAHLDWYVPLAAWFVVMIISAGAITISVKRIRSITIATILRFEG